MRCFKDFVNTPFAKYVLPIIPVGAKLVAGSTLTPDRLGKIPGRRYSDKATGETGWGGFTKSRPWQDEWKLRQNSERSIPGIMATLDRWYEQDGFKPVIGMRSRELPAIDCDIEDAFIADLAFKIFTKRLGDAPVRRRPNSNKFLLCFRHLLTDPSIPKIRRLWETPFGVRFAVEVLCEGQQWLGWGPHPSGVDYAWDLGTDPLTVGMDGLNVVTLDAIFAALDEFEQEVDRLIGAKRVKGDGGARLSGIESRPREPVSLTTGDRAPSPDMLKDVLATYLPVTHHEFITYDEWATMCVAIVAACGRDEEFYPFFLGWNSENPANDEAMVRGKWESVKEASVGWGYICHIAHEYGYAGDVAGLMEELPVSDELPSVPAPAAPRVDANKEAVQIDMLVERHAHKTLLFASTKTSGEWMRCVNGLWQSDQTALFEARQVCCAVADVIERNNPQLNAAQRRKVDKLNSVSTWEAVLRGARHDPRIVVPHSRFDDVPIIMGTPAGLISAKGELVDPDPCLLLCSSTGVTPDFDADCPQFKGMMRRMVGEDEELYKFWWQALGYSILGLSKEQLLMFLVDDGTGRTGKSTFCAIMQGVLGDYAMPIANDVFAAGKVDAYKYTWATLKGKRFVYADEIERGEKWAVAKLKQVSGGGTIQIERKFLGPEPMRLQPTLWFMANNLPEFPAGDGALLRRLAVIRVVSPFEEHEDVRGFAELVIKQEGRAILAHLIREAQAYLKRGFLVVPEKVRAATAEAMKSRDEFIEFVEDNCETGPDQRASGTVLVRAYEAWAAAENVKRTLSRRAFLRMMEEHYEMRRAGVRRVRHIDSKNPNSPRGFVGVGLKDVVAETTALRGVA